LTTPPGIGVIGGTGFYRFLDDVEEVVVQTPFGPPSSPVSVGTVAGRRVAFIARHGRDHEVPAHQVNYRANLWALRRLGIGRVLAPCSVGSLQSHLRPGHFVLCDQLVDRTRGRVDTYFDGPTLAHVSFADPYCSELRLAVTRAAEGLHQITLHPTGTVVVIQGPRFSTRAESRWFSASGWDVVNMTQYPEAVLARELNLCYSGIALVTDFDAGLEGVDGIAPVTMETVFAVLAANVANVTDLLLGAIPEVPLVAGCACGQASQDPGALPL